MYIAWDYLDKKSAAVSALKDFTDMEHIIQNTPDEITETRETMTAVKIPTVSETPKGTPDPRVGETRLVSQIDEIDVLKERYRRALDFMAWFTPAWNKLSGNEKFVLLEFYRGEYGDRVDAIGYICDHFHIERSSAYKKKNRALAKLALLLYGK